MKKKYMIPDLEVIQFETEDVMTTSGVVYTTDTLGFNKYSSSDSSGWGYVDSSSLHSAN
jgi:hypothetical protein